MSYEIRKDQNVRDIEFLKLAQGTTALETRVQDWVNRATALHGVSDTAEQDDVLAMRDAFVLNLRTILGV